MRMRMHQIAVPVLVLVLVVMVILVQVNVEFSPGNRGFLIASDVEVISVEAKLLQFTLELAGIDPEIDHRANKHVAADAAENIQIKGFHDPLAASALIWLAAYPAPKPLSIFTTVTPLPQLFSMPSKAANPPKFAP